MNYEIKLSSFAASDLDEIWNYIAHVLKSPIAANNTVNGIIDSISVLKDFPESGTILYFESDLQSGYRYVVYKNYLAFYHLFDNQVYVDRVIYGKRDYMTLLFKDLK